MENAKLLEMLRGKFGYDWFDATDVSTLANRDAGAWAALLEIEPGLCDKHDAMWFTTSKVRSLLRRITELEGWLEGRFNPKHKYFYFRVKES